MNLLDNIMQDSSISEVIKSNVSKYTRACIAYYGTKQPIMDDDEFDELENELLSADIDIITEYIREGITRGNAISTSHRTHDMISLKKIKIEKTMDAMQSISYFTKQPEIARCPDKTIYASAKFDGLSLRVKWQKIDGNLSIEQIQTRGGQDVTLLLMNVNGIKTKPIDFDKSPFVCGELVVKKQIFQDKYSRESGNKYKNARNFMNACIAETATPEMLADIDFIPCTDGLDLFMSATNPVWHVITNGFLQTIMQKFYDFYKSDKFPYMVDGIVLAMIEPTGERRIKDNYPMNMVALKFPAPRATTKVIGIEWTQKKTTKLTPVLLLDPVPLEGSMVSRASIYNWSKMKENKVGVGAVIEIAKSGDIIPVHKKTVTPSTNFVMPEVEYTDDGQDLVAVDEAVSLKYRFVLGLKLLDISSVGEKNAELIGQALGWDIVKVFDTNRYPAICSALGAGAVWQKFNGEMATKKTIHLDLLIQILQFDDVGPTIAKRIANILLKNSTDTSNIAGHIKMSLLKKSGFGFIRLQQVLKELQSYGIQVLAPIDINSDDTITFEMSGDPKVDGLAITKSKFVELLKQKYPKSHHTSLTKTTKYLFVDDISSNTGKANKARKYNIEIMTYDDALKKQL